MLRVHGVWDNANILQVEVLPQKIRCAFGNRANSDSRIGVNPALQRSEQSIVGPAVQRSKKTGMRIRLGILLARELLQSMKQRVNDHDIRTEAIDSWRKNQIVSSTARYRVPAAQEPIQEHPSKELRHMRTREGLNFVPEDGTRMRGARR